MDIFIIRDILNLVCNYLNTSEIYVIHKAFQLSMDIKWLEILINNHKGYSNCYICYTYLGNKRGFQCHCCSLKYCTTCIDKYKRYCEYCKYATLCIGCMDRNNCIDCHYI